MLKDGSTTLIVQSSYWNDAVKSAGPQQSGIQLANIIGRTDQKVLLVLFL
jgi:hypothetical protein